MSKTTRGYNKRHKTCPICGQQKLAQSFVMAHKEGEDTNLVVCICSNCCSHSDEYTYFADVNARIKSKRRKRR